MLKKIAISVFTTFLMVPQAKSVTVPGSVPPVSLANVGLYADDTRGIAVPGHDQLRLQDNQELLSQAKVYSDDGVTFSDSNGNAINTAAKRNEKKENEDLSNQIERIASESGYMSQAQVQAQAQQQSDSFGLGFANAIQVNPQTAMMPMQQPMMQQPIQPMVQQQGFVQMPMQQQAVTENYRTVPTPTGMHVTTSSVTSDGGVEIATGQVRVRHLDMKNATVRLKEDRITVRRIIRRMMDQIGGGSWDVVWSLSAENATLPDMEVSIYTQEPFMNVMNALLARLQTRSGQSLRVIKYEKSQKLVITDQQGKAPVQAKAAGVKTKGKMAITEQVLKEAKVVLHYDEIPLVDAIENMVNQASCGQWRLRVYAGMDQVLKPAHIEEPFNIAMERVLGLFNLKYEIFPGGKLIVVTSGSSNYTNMQQ